MIRTLPRSMRRIPALLFLLLAAVTALAQAPSADWKTIATEHFRIHYPREYEAWAFRAAERIENVHAAVSREVGFTPPQTIDVVIANPIAEPNGIAWPLVDTPRIIFYAEPPAPDDQIGAYAHWIDLLAVHEVAHVVHMLRPSRNPLSHAIESSVLPLAPITLSSPRWLLEGYATVVEGRLTGTGRPSSTIRALILRRWAEVGRLPTYAQLDSDRRFLGMSMAYLMGSAFLEWLEQREGTDALRRLWLRQTARKKRSFDEAFIGVFGEPPDRMYGRFLAEVTASALTVERSAPLHEGELFQQTSWSSGDPAVSPDGRQLAIVIRRREEPDRLVVWSTEVMEKEEKEQAERIAKILERDPEDVAPVRRQPLARKEAHALTMPDGGDIVAPRWAADGGSILFSHRVPDPDGFLHFDLFRWTPASGALARVTRLADVREADPLPDGRRAIAVRSRGGATERVTIDLASGGVTSDGEASVDVVRTRPRVSPDGSRIAEVVHRDGRWSLLVDDRPIELPGDPAAPAWLSNEALVVTIFTSGFAELYRVGLDGTAEPLTRSAGGAFTPAVGGSAIYFMSLTPEGYVVRKLDANQPVQPWPELSSTLVPAIPPPSGTGEPFASDATLTPRSYGIGRQEPFWFAGFNEAPQHRAFEGGVRFGDVVGRLDTLLVGSIGAREAPEGGALIASWRGWPLELRAHLYATTGLGDDDRDSGGELRGIWSRRGWLHRITLEGGGSNEIAFGSAALAVRHRLAGWNLEEGLRIERLDAQNRGAIAIGARSGGFRAGVRYTRADGGEVTVGGLASSILPRSSYADRILDPALPPGTLLGDDYEGWRGDASIPALPVTMFFQQHTVGGAKLRLAGLLFERSFDPNPIVKLPGLDFTAGVARILDAPMKGETQWWFGMRWRP